MPLYEYECLACGKRTEQLRSFSDPPLSACPICGGEVKKLFSAPAVQFKGTGWYATDYAAKKAPEGKSDSKSSESSDSSGIVSKGDKPAAEKSGSSESAPKSAPADSPKS